MELNNVAENKVKGWAFVKKVMNFRVPLIKLNFFTDCGTVHPSHGELH
jgi:hypothetical protein